MTATVQPSGSDVAEPGAIAAAMLRSLAGRRTFDDPYSYSLCEALLPGPVADALATLPLPSPGLDGVSGKRELHNDSRRYFDAELMGRFGVAAATAQACQSPTVVGALADAFGTRLDGTFLRLEYAQDVDGFWLEPHTDLGVKALTCLIYLSAEEGHDTLGTDIYRDPAHHVGRSPFRRNTAMVFVPGSDTWHGFEKRPITGVRRSVILNYVTPAWRAREQLSFPDQPVQA